ncbi:hypothetical protein [Arthrobacter mobilis]|uniref:hypothetical protein n=1 Tax=Arthrobacter mobilis TaxID=2724944 RepID=UPI00197B1573|nr:hypothetical protein [Arthrobacter mobilis]
MSSEQSPAPGRGVPGPGLPRRELSVRRAPKFTPFLAAGAVLGVVAAAVVALAGPENAEFTRGSIFGFFAVLFGTAGLLAGGIVALVLDRLSVRRAELILAEETGPAEETGTAEETSTAAQTGTDGPGPAEGSAGQADPDGPDAPGTAHR